MRIIAGTAGGRRISAPPAGTRPTSDRVREALFSALDPRLRDARVLDLFAGSGALGIEALSRGAASATFVERSRAAYRIIVANLDQLGLASRGSVLHAEVTRALRADLPGTPFDIVLADPPYGVSDVELRAVLEQVVPLLAPSATVIVERSRRTPEPAWPPPLGPVRTRRYGDTVLHEARADSAGGDQRRRREGGA